MPDAIRSTWAGEMLPFEVMRITCRRQNLSRASSRKVMKDKEDRSTLIRFRDVVRVE
jgi:hypothetical protein